MTLNSYLEHIFMNISSNEQLMPTVTMWFIIATCFMWLAYEIYTLYYKKETISTAINRLACRHPILLVMLGILLGHWFW